jgi:hypothetical protein
MVKAPFGFPQIPEKWRIMTSANYAEAQSTPTSGTYYNIGGEISVPIGSWRLGYEANPYITRATTGFLEQHSALSTSTSTFTDQDLVSIVLTNTALALSATVKKEKNITVTSKTLYYMVIRCSGSTSGIASIGFNSSSTAGSRRLYAICNYL